MADTALPPGPRLPGAAQAVLWGLRYPEFTRAAHARYGDTFTVRPGTMPASVLTTDRDAVKRLLTGDPLGKQAANEVVRPLLGDASLFLIDPPRHLARRKLLLPPFHGDRIRAYADTMRTVMEQEVARWRPGEAVAVLPLAQNVTIEVILQAVLGVADEDLRSRFRRLIDDLLFYPMGSLRLRLSARAPSRIRPPRRVREVAALAASLPTPAVMTYFPQLKVRSPWMVSTRRWWRHRDGLIALLDEHVARVRDDPHLAEREDILSMLVQARDEDGNALGDEVLREDLIGLIGAGHETTAAAIAWGAVLLAHDPATQERAARAAREDDEEYLGALAKEVLRLRSPIPVGGARTLEEPFPIGAHRVPPGTPVMVDAWGLHHDARLHPEPERLRPERFLDGGPEPYTWLPFGGGAHRCLGAALAELEMRVAFSTILRRVSLAPADREPAPPARRGITIVPHGGGRVRVEPAALAAK